MESVVTGGYKVVSRGIGGTGGELLNRGEKKDANGLWGWLNRWSRRWFKGCSGNWFELK
jgi:hypothetical protein